MKHLELLARLVSVSSTLLTETGEANQTDLYNNRIHEYEGIAEYHPPPCVIIIPSEWNITQQGLEKDERWNPELTIELVRALPAQTAAGLTTQSREVMGKIQDIVDEILAAAGSDTDFLDATQTYVGIQTLSLIAGPYKASIAEANLTVTDPDDATQQVVWGVTFSVEGY